MRGFLIPLLVGDETVLISPRKLMELYSRGEVRVVRVSGQREEELQVRGLNDAYSVAKSIALGKDIEVIFTGQYDMERGIP